MKQPLGTGASSSPPVPGRARRAVLVGPVHQENLALGYLASAARRAGHEAEIVGYGGRVELAATLARTLALTPDLIGLGLAFQNDIHDHVVLLQALRERGFAGHLTCGGHVPTFCYEELLRDVPGLDSVVRHDGEETLVEMLDRLARGEPVRDLQGLVWREGARVERGPLRAAVADLDTLPWPARSPEPYLVGGVVVDFVLTARGCVGECNYCSIAAYGSEQQKRYRLRRPEAVADELAAQYHARGARVAFVQDDLFVLPGEKKNLDRAARLRQALRERGAADLVLWVKGRPESVTPAVCEALADLGVVHMFLGVESASAARLEYLGRLHQPHDNRTALANCRAAGIVPSFNFMLFDPDCSLADIAETLALAEEHLDLPWNICRTEVYSGTSLRERLAREGRLEGDYRSYGYAMREARAEVLFRILRVSLQQHAFEIESLLNRLISLSFARQIHERFFPGSATDALARHVVELCVETRGATVAALRRALVFAESEDVRDEARVRRFAVSEALALNARDRERSRRAEELWQHLNLRGARLMARRGVPLPAGVRDAWSVALGS